LYPENHGILGNYFYSRREGEQFLLEGLNNESFWWDKAEPIWTTAVRDGLRVATVLWARSDVPVRGLLPEKAEGYVVAKGVKAVEKTLERVACYLSDGFDLVMVIFSSKSQLSKAYNKKLFFIQSFLFTSRFTENLKYESKKAFFYLK